LFTPPDGDDVVRKSNQPAAFLWDTSGPAVFPAVAQLSRSGKGLRLNDMFALTFNYNIILISEKGRAKSSKKALIGQVE
jgi:hypothetical protein